MAKAAAATTAATVKTEFRTWTQVLSPSLSLHVFVVAPSAFDDACTEVGRMARETHAMGVKALFLVVTEDGKQMKYVSQTAPPEATIS